MIPIRDIPSVGKEKRERKAERERVREETELYAIEDHLEIW